MTTLLPAGALDRLATDLDGALVRPGDPNWDTARQAWNLAADQRPTAVVLAESARDITLAVDVARELGLRIAPQGTGHNAAPLGDLAGTILLRTSGMRGVQIDPVTRVARIEAGAWWLDVTTAAADYGLAALAGSSPDVGVAGYVLGGGISWLGRSHGLAANTIQAIEIVTADGRLRRVDALQDPDLFWALRGGGGSFGVVTAIELKLFPITEVYAGVLFFPVERAREVLWKWRSWAATVPESITSVGRILHFPPLPDLPPHLSGKSWVVLEAACQVPGDEARALLAPLLELGPALDTFRPTPMTELSALHMDPPGPVPGHGDGMLLDGLDASGVAAFVDASQRHGTALLSMEIRHLGGALRTGRVSGGVVSGVDAEFALFAVGVTPTPEAMGAVRLAVADALTSMQPWASEAHYLNFSESRRPATSFFGEATEQLEAIKHKYDPRDLIRSNHPVNQ